MIYHFAGLNCQAIVEHCERDVSSENDKDFNRQVSSYANWGKLLTPAPMAISLLGELVFISANVDFKLGSKMPIGGFKYLKYPDSFRACLVQISNSGWQAFNEAHGSMDQIRLMSGTVDTHVKEAIRIISKCEPLEIDKMLPHVLKSIDDIANESLNLAKHIEEKFGNVMDLTGELLEVSTNKKTDHEEKVRQIKAEQMDTQFSIQHDTQLKQSHEDRLKNMEKRIDRAQKDYEDAVKNQPGAVSILGLSFAEGLVDAVRNITSLPSEIIRGLGFGTYGIFGKLIQRTKENKMEDPKSLETLTAEFNVLSQVSLIDASIDDLLCILETNENEGSHVEKKNQIDAIKHQFVRYLSRISSETESGKLGKKISDMCKTGLEICESLRSSLSSIETTDTQSISDNQQKCRDLKTKIRKCKTKALNVLGRNPLDERSPCLPQRPIQTSTNAVFTLIEEARYKIQFAKAVLEDTQKRHDLAEHQVESTDRVITEAMRKMQKLNIEEVDFETIKTALKEGIYALAEVRAQWGNLVMFFREISNVISTCMNTSLKKFTQTISVRAELKEANQMMSMAFRANMYDQTLHASKISFLVSDMATSYVNVSVEHIMPGVHQLQKYIGLDGSQHKTELVKARDELRQHCIEAQEAIRFKIIQQHETFKQEAIIRTNEIEQKFKELIPPTESHMSIDDIVLPNS